jgi:rhodanese-related sulfurtransferase
MKKILILLFTLLISLNAEVIKQPPTQELLNKNIPIIDIRTPQEWRETGLLKGSIPIMFFDKNKDFDIEKFVKELKEKVDTSKPFALICRTGHRTSIVSKFLSKQYRYTIIDLAGGVVEAKKRNLPFEPYNK